MSVECVPGVAAGVAGRAPIIVAGGFRRGSDIFKALALGATAVGVGRPGRRITTPFIESQVVGRSGIHQASRLRSAVAGPWR